MSHPLRQIVLTRQQPRLQHTMARHALCFPRLIEGNQVNLKCRLFWHRVNALHGTEVDEGELDSEEEEDLLEDEVDEFEEPPVPFYGPPAVILAGFYIEELPGVRHLLDEAGGHSIPLIPCTPALLQQPLAAVLQLQEPAWEDPVPSHWVDGGGWGLRRTLVFSGSSLDSQGSVLQLLEESQMGEVCAAAATPDDAGRRLGDVLASVLASQRNRAQGIQFSEQLPALEHIIQLPSTALSQIEGTPSELTESATEPDDAALDLDIIDRMAAAAQADPPAAEMAPSTSRQPQSGSTTARQGTHGSPTPSGTSGTEALSSVAEASRHPLDERSDVDPGSDGDSTTLPGVEQFVLSRRRLKEMAEEVGLDYAALLSGLKEKGIELEP